MAVALAQALAASGAWAQADRQALRPADMEPGAATALLPNASFVPPETGALDAPAFQGTLSVAESPMTTDPAEFTSREVLGKDPMIFPAFAISFTTVDGDLVPATQDVIRAGALPEGESFWDIIVQPGRVWKEEGDGEWSRASFPFALMHSIEGETHNGVAMFLYRDGEVSGLRYQILSQTAPFYVVDYFTASGVSGMSYANEFAGDPEAVAAEWVAAKEDALPVADWAALSERAGPEALEGFDSDIAPEDVVAEALVLDGTLYVKSCPTVMGELPYCDRQRFGVWSVTKAAANAAALMRLAEVYGPAIMDEPMSAYVPEMAEYEGWKDVTFGNALNMATGMGYGSPEAEPVNITDPFLDPYYAWYEAPSVAGKLAVLLPAAQPYPWGPGAVARYRDEDMFLLGVAMSRYLQAKGSEYPTIWEFLVDQVYEPLGIHYAPINRTIEPAGGTDQPLMAYGFYPTLGDIAKIAQLFQDGGRIGDTQILNADLVAEIQPAPEPVGLPTGNEHLPYYRYAFWRGATEGCQLSYPIMLGWGGNHVSLFPGVTTIRLAKDWDGDERVDMQGSIQATAEAIGGFCD